MADTWKDQSPLVSSSTAEEAAREAGEDAAETQRWLDEDVLDLTGAGAQKPKRWEGMDVLDLTGGTGDPSHPPFTVSFPTRHLEEEEDEEERPSWADSLEPSPEDEEPSSISSAPPRAPAVPSAPAEERPPVPRRAPSGSVDKNLSPLPAASAPLMLSSADKVMELQPFSTVSAGQEELASLLLESTTSLPSLSPLSADSSKEHAVTVAFPADLPATEALHGSISNMYAVSRTIGDFSLAENVGNMVHDYSDVTAGCKQEASVLDQIKEDVIFSEKGYVVEHPTSQQETISEDHTQLFAQSAKEMFSGMLKSVGPPHEEFSDNFKEAFGEQYVDFKPFVNTSSWDIDYEGTPVAEKCKSDVGNLNLESNMQMKEKYTEEKEMDMYDYDSPVTPEAVPPESSQSKVSSNYEMFAALENSNPFSIGGGPIVRNKTDEKKMEEIEAHSSSLHFGLNIATVNPFFEHVGQEGDYITTQSASGSPPAQVTNKSEGLTPDIVQEAYESEVHEFGIPKPGYESKIDLVQTASVSVQKPVGPSTQPPALFEDPDSVSSPVLPDIVTEAPLTAAAVDLDAIALQPDVSPIKNVPTVKEIKFESEKPPSYEEAVNKPILKAYKDRAVTCVKPEQGATFEEAETPYISIACDLIKETITTESAAPGFTDLSNVVKNEFDSQFIQYFDDSSPESEHSEPSYKHWEPEVIPREALGVMTSGVKPQNMTSERGHESDQKLQASSPTKAYLESTQPELNIYKTSTDHLEEVPVAEMSKKQDKPLQMEEFGKVIYSAEFSSSKYSPITEGAGFESRPTIPGAENFYSKALGDAQREVGHDVQPPEDQILKNKSSLETKQETYSELYHDESLINNEHGTTEPSHRSGKSNDFSKAVSDVPGVYLAPKGESLVAEETVAKPRPATLVKEADLDIPAKKEKNEGKDPSVGAPLLSSDLKLSVVDLLYWRDIKKTGVVFGASLFLLLSLTVFSIVSVTAYIGLALLSVSISFRIYKGILQAIQKSEEGHPFQSYLESNVAVSEELVQKYCNVTLSHINCTIKELRRLFLVEDLVDSLKFAVLMWVFTYIGALFNGLTLLILALISLFSVPVIYERHQTQIDHYIGLINKSVKDTSAMIVSKIPGLKRKPE
ncbi:reticulon-4 isoform X1 [Ascaphus truei]|uniref:reticulon-4 isoform X1 n=1 Tax=Ascaphus truei TaxID=8439 RepID=UPI003F5938AC